MNICSICGKGVCEFIATCLKTITTYKTITERVIKKSFFKGFIKITEDVKKEIPETSQVKTTGEICSSCCHNKEVIKYEHKIINHAKDMASQLTETAHINSLLKNNPFPIIDFSEKEFWLEKYLDNKKRSK